ncbi:MAG TPA: hypothetical protein VGI74_05425 [Streptosporangiaceae bacterium]|jgi:hypothetical protein
MILHELASPFNALSLMLRIGSIGVAITSLESLVRPGDLGPGGLLSGEVQLTRARWLLPFGFLASQRVTVAVTVIRLLAACAVVAGGSVFEVARAGAIVIALATLLIRIRTPLSIHAAGTMVMVTFTGAALGLGVGTHRSMEFALDFIAAQACLSYFVAGASKLRTPSWRSGRAIPAIASTLMWGNGHQAAVLNSHRRAAFVLCWVTMTAECAFPLTLAVPLQVTILLLASAAMFHIITAIEMGLNSFVWAFGSTYPAIIFCWYLLHG